jgi:uncharacterized protein (DUF934 family)
MPRRLLRDGNLVNDDWRYWNEDAAADGGTLDEPGADTDYGLIISYEAWFAERARWLAHAGRLGIVLLPAEDVRPLERDLSALGLIAADFPSPSEGRGYSQGRLLRERHKFGGELRARGRIGQDQVFFLARCGFNAFELPEAELPAARAALGTFSTAYQASNDRGLEHPLRARW